MSFRGNFRDLSLVDILQVVQMTQKSGVLEIEDGPRKASIAFRQGNIVDARPNGTPPRLTEDLEARGQIPAGAGAKAAAEPSPPGQVERIGEKLVRLGFITEPRLREILLARVENTVYETLSWVNGSFDFVIGETESAASPVFAVQDVLPGVDFNTQQVLMDALRVFDEKRSGRPTLESQPVAAPEHPPERPRLLLAGAASFREGTRIAVMRLRADLMECETLAEVPDLLVESADRPTLLVCNLEPGNTSLREEISQIQLHSRCLAVVTVGSDPSQAAEAIAAGAFTHVGILDTDPGPALAYLQAVVAQRMTVLTGTTITSPKAAGAGLLENFSARIGHLRSKLDMLAGEAHTSSVTLKILEFVAERMERGLLFLVRPSDLQGIGAFGQTVMGEPIGPLVSALRLPLGPESAFRKVIDRRESLLCELDEDDARRILYASIGAPNPLDVVLLPLVSVGDVVALIYADNGLTGRPISDHAELDVLVRQAGLVLENALLRRMLERKRTAAPSA